MVQFQEINLSKTLSRDERKKTKLKKLVAVLKTAILKTNANTLHLNFQDQSRMDQNENDKIWHEIIAEWAREINLQHVSIFLLVVIMSVVFAIVYKLWCQKTKINFKFAIEI